MYIVLLSCDVKLLQEKKPTFGRRRRKINTIIIIFSSISASLEPFTLSYIFTYSSNCDDLNGFKFI